MVAPHILEEAPHKMAAVPPNSLTIHVKWDRTCWSLQEIKKNSQASFSFGLLPTDIPAFTDEKRLTFIYSVLPPNAAWKTCQKRWPIGWIARENQGYPCSRYCSMMIMMKMIWLYICCFVDWCFHDLFQIAQKVIYIYIYYIIGVLVVTKSLCGYVLNQV